MWSNRLHEAGAWMRHLISAKGPHGVHSPFVYNLITNVLRDRTRSTKFDDIERERVRLKSCRDEIEVTDFGAGSRASNGNVRRISTIANSALQPASHARALSLLAAHAQATNILELGTSLGITTAHLASALPKATIYTLEGCEAISLQAKRVWSNLGITNIEIVSGEFDSQLVSVLQRMKQVDFVIIDGNHTAEACLRYIEWIEPFTHENTVIVVDDIYWSPSMTAGWEKCVGDARYSLTLDFFDFGVLYGTPGRVKEHFLLKRPWLRTLSF